MTRYVEVIPKVVEAKQFEGGQQNFVAIVNWLYANGYHHTARNASWTPNVQLPGGTHIPEVFRIHGYISYSGGGVQIKIGQWIVLNGEPDFDIVDQDEFDRLYEEVPVAVSDAERDSALSALRQALQSPA